MRSGCARPGQTSSELLDIFAPDLILDFVHGYLLSKMTTQKQRDDFYAKLDAASLKPIDKWEARRAQARANMIAMNKRNK